MTLKQLEAFYWAATCASFALAAERVHLSVSSLSKRISELEAFLGLQLFDRSGRRARLTADGEQLLPQARELLQAADRLSLSAGRRSRGLHGRCRFGVGELTSLTWLPKLVAAARAHHPDLQMEPRVGVGQALEQGVESGELDFAIIAGASTRSAIASHFIGQTRFLWVMAAALHDGTAMTPARMREHHLITLPEGAGTTRLLDHWFTANPGAHGGKRLICENWGAVAGLLKEGLGVGILPEGWAQALAGRGDLLILEGMPPLETLFYSFQWRRDDTRALVSHMRPLAEAAIDFSAPICLI